MRRILFQWRGIIVPSYRAMLYIGLVAVVVAGNVAAHIAEMDAFRVLVANLVLLVPALLGARLLFVATHWGLFRRNLRRILNSNEGGAT
jgi:prolipoprotein diacylglyceryltransferase